MGITCCTLEDGSLFDIMDMSSRRSTIEETKKGSLLGKPKNKSIKTVNNNNTQKHPNSESSKAKEIQSENQHIFETSDTKSFLLDIDQKQNIIKSDDLVINDNVSINNKKAQSAKEEIKNEEIVQSKERLQKLNAVDTTDIADVIRKQYSFNKSTDPKSNIGLSDKSSDEDAEENVHPYHHKSSRNKEDGTERYLLRNESRAVWDNTHLSETVYEMRIALEQMKEDQQYEKNDGEDTPSSLFRMQSSATWTKEDVYEESSAMQLQLVHLMKNTTGNIIKEEEEVEVEDKVKNENDDKSEENVVDYGLSDTKKINK